MFCRFRPSPLGNDGVRKNTLAGEDTAGRIVRFVLRNRIAQFLRKQIRQIGSADFAGKRTGFVGEIAGAVGERWYGNQAGVDSLALPRTLIIAKVEDFILPDGTAHGAAELVLPVKAAFGRKEVARIEIGVAQELKGAAMQCVGT